MIGLPSLHYNDVQYVGNSLSEIHVAGEQQLWKLQNEKESKLPEGESSSFDSGRCTTIVQRQSKTVVWLCFLQNAETFLQKNELLYLHISRSILSLRRISGIGKRIYYFCKKSSFLCYGKKSRVTNTALLDPDVTLTVVMSHCKSLSPLKVIASKMSSTSEDGKRPDNTGI